MDYRDYKNFKENTTHGNLMLPFVKYFSSIPTYFKFYPQHWHDEMEIIYVTSGRGIISINLEDHIGQKGDIIIIGPGVLHSIGQHESDNMEFDSIVFNINMLVNHTGDACSVKYLTPLQHSELIFPFIINEQDKFYNDILSFVIRLLDIYEEKSYGYELELKSYLFLLFHVLFSNKLLIKDKKALTDDSTVAKIKQIVTYIEDHYTKDITIDDMAKLCNFSESHFMKFFKAHMGVTFVGYLNDFRLNIASKMLISTDLPILSIGMDVGYGNLSYFNRIFKRKFLITPSEFRKTSRS